MTVYAKLPRLSAQGPTNVVACDKNLGKFETRTKSIQGVTEKTRLYNFRSSFSQQYSFLFLFSSKAIFFVLIQF